jgi:hypothetical protein
MARIHFTNVSLLGWVGYSNSSRMGNALEAGAETAGDGVSVGGGALGGGGVLTSDREPGSVPSMLSLLRLMYGI